MGLMDNILNCIVEEKQVAIFWLGQAGFVIKDCRGRIVTIDPYLTDCCEREFGFKRLSPKLISPSELKTNILFSTHSHLDHFDIDAVPIIMSDKNSHLIGSKTAAEKCLEMGIEKSRVTDIKENQTVDFGWVKFYAVYADHGDLAPDAIGVVIYISGITIYFTGDTAYRPEKMQKAIAVKPDIIILPINGAYGNLNEKEAAMLVHDTQARIAIPCHFWTFSVHGGNPQLFVDEMKRIAPNSKTKFLRQGESFLSESQEESIYIKREMNRLKEHNRK